MFCCGCTRSSSEVLLGLWPIDTVELGIAMESEQNSLRLVAA